MNRPAARRGSHVPSAGEPGCDAAGSLTGLADRHAGIRARADRTARDPAADEALAPRYGQ